MDATRRRTRTGDPGSGVAPTGGSTGPQPVQGGGNAGANPAPGVGDALAQALQALAGVEHDRRDATDAERLEWLRAARQLARQSEALYKQLVAEADQADSTKRLHGTPTTSWLALDGQTSTREASGVVHSGRDLGRHPEVRKQALAGQIAVKQATAITKVISELPPTLTPEQVGHAEQLLLEEAKDTPAEVLQKSTARILEQVRPSSEGSGVEDELDLLEEQKRRAHQRRHLFIWDDNDGSVTFKGSLPTLEAEGLRRLIASYVEADRRRGREQGDPHAEVRTPEQRRADALVQLLTDHHQHRRAPGVAGDRPRVVVIMQEDSLRERAEQAGCLSTGETIPAGDLRRIVCDADLTPVVLGTHSEVLDVGRDHRLVTPELRRLLSGRDGGCQFPNCQSNDERCEAHHIHPWWAGGATSLENLVSLCPHHHNLIEPERFWTDPGPDRWQVRTNHRGRIEFLPPRRLDPERKPLPGNATKRGAPHNRAAAPDLLVDQDSEVPSMTSRTAWP